MPIDPADPASPRRRSILPIILLLIVALLIGMGTMAWMIRRVPQVAQAIVPPVPAAAPAPRPLLVQPAPTAAAAIDTAVVSDRIEKIEDKVDEIGQRATAASSEAERAEGFLVAFAARRAIDRGVSLGYLEGPLRERFGGVEPQAVATVISASHQPVTVEQLRDQLAGLAPQLSGPTADDGWWASIRRELGGLIVVRQGNVPSMAPVDRIDRAKADLDAGHVDAALAEVARLPGRKAADPWIANARRYVQARIALDQIETAALLRPSAPTPAATPVK